MLEQIMKAGADLLDSVADGKVDPEDLAPLTNHLAERLQEQIGDKIDDPDEQERLRRVAASLRILATFS